jgi:hypothetical protein
MRAFGLEKQTAMQQLTERDFDDVARLLPPIDGYDAVAAAPYASADVAVAVSVDGAADAGSRDGASTSASTSAYTSASTSVSDDVVDAVEWLLKDRRARKAGGCTCPRNQCRQLYCACRARGSACSDACCCRGCTNVNPVAAANDARLRKSAAPAQSCRCRRSRCLKRYCDCYRSGVACGDLCGCANCSNRGSVTPPQRHHPHPPPQLWV